MIRSLFLRRGWLIPLVLGLFVDNVRGTPVRSAALLAAAGWAAVVHSSLRRAPAVSRAFVLFILCAGLGAEQSVYLSNTLNELSLLGGAALLFWGAAALFEAEPGEKVFFAKSLIVLALARGVLVLALPAESGRVIFEPGYAGVSNRSFTSMFMALGVLAGGEAPGKPWRAARAALFAMTAWVCTRWGSTSALLGMAVGLPLAEAFRRGSRRFFLAAGGVGAAALVLLFVVGSGRLRYRADDPNRLERLNIWADSLSLAVDNPLGTGFGTFEQYYPQYKSLPGGRTANFAHNEWIQLLCEGGVPGAFLGLFLLAGLARRMRAGSREAPGVATSLVVLWLWSLVYFVFRADGLLFAGALLAAQFSRPTDWPPSRRARQIVTVLAAAVAVVAFVQGGAQLWESRGGAAWGRADYGTALAHFRKASRWNPWEPRFLDEQVECLRSLDRKPETLPLLERAVALKPRDVWLRRKLAVARLNLSGAAAARETYAPILELAPNVPQFRREYQELSKR